jgi:hypothetical protein
VQVRGETYFTAQYQFYDPGLPVILAGAADGTSQFNVDDGMTLSVYSSRRYGSNVEQRLFGRLQPSSSTIGTDAANISVSARCQHHFGAPPRYLRHQ